LVEKERRASRRWRTIALLAIGVAIGATLTATPVYSHVGGTVTHLWSKHIRPKTDALYHTKAAADTRYVNVGEKATAAAQADSAARAADADTFDGADSTAFLRATGKAADAELFDGINSDVFVTKATPAGGALAGNYPNPVVATNAIGSPEVRNDSLTGSDVDEGSLAQVPSAASVDGQSATTFNFNVPTGNYTVPHGLATLFVFQGLTLKASCERAHDTDQLSVYAYTDTDNSYLRTSLAGSAADADFDAGLNTMAGTTWNALFHATGDGAGVLIYRRGGSAAIDAQVTSVTLAWDTNPTGNDCMLAGAVIGH
jgi:hypothetical protein